MDQISRIEQGFKELGCTLIQDQNADLVYCHDSSQYSDAIFYKLTSNNPQTKLLLKVLDIPTHNSNYDYDGMKKTLESADLVLANSYTVWNQIKQHFNIISFVVYETAKQVKPIYPRQDLFKMFFVGRANDPNKRFNLVKKVANKLGINPLEVAIAGPENPGWGNYLGIVSDEALSELYNNSRLTILPSRIEGVGLPMIESLMVERPPIVCLDNPTALEFASTFCYPSDVDGFSEAVNKFLTNDIYYNEIVDHIRSYEAPFYRRMFSPIEASRRILNAYESISSNNNSK